MLGYLIFPQHQPSLGMEAHPWDISLLPVGARDPHSRPTPSERNLSLIHIPSGKHLAGRLKRPQLYLLWKVVPEGGGGMGEAVSFAESFIGSAVGKR